MGRPTIPSLVVDGRAVPILHVSQIAEALGLPPPPPGSPVRDGADAAAILDAWLGRIRETPWSALLAPTPARGRCLRELTVNVFHPFELLPPAWTSGELDWRPEDDGAREAELASHDDLIAFAEAAATGWRRFRDEHDLAGRDPLVDTPRGQRSVLDARWPSTAGTPPTTIASSCPCSATPRARSTWTSSTISLSRATSSRLRAWRCSPTGPSPSSSSSRS